MKMEKEKSVDWMLKRFLELFEPTANDDPTIIGIMLGAKERHKQEMVDFGYSLLSTIQSESEDMTYTKLPEELYRELYETKKA
jgi:hypothetical protein